MEEAKFYRFYNQYNTMLYQGEHKSMLEAWQGFWDHCRYPADYRNINDCVHQGIRCEEAK